MSVYFPEDRAKGRDYVCEPLTLCSSGFELQNLENPVPPAILAVYLLLEVTNCLEKFA